MNTDGPKQKMEKVRYNFLKNQKSNLRRFQKLRYNQRKIHKHKNEMKETNDRNTKDITIKILSKQMRYKIIQQSPSIKNRIIQTEEETFTEEVPIEEEEEAEAMDTIQTETITITTIIIITMITISLTTEQE